MRISRTVLTVGAAACIVLVPWILGHGRANLDEAAAPDTEPAREPLVLPGPDLTNWKRPPVPGASRDTPASHAYPLFAQARYHNAPVYQSTRGRFGRGLLRYGGTTRARWLGNSTGCKGGHWYELLDGGYVCSVRGFRVLEGKPAFPTDARPPEVDHRLPYEYAKLENRGTLRLRRLATREQWDEAMQAPDPEKLDLVRDRMQGAYFFALAEVEEASDGTKYYRTVRGDYVRVEDVSKVEPPEMHGEALDETTRLPIAFVYGDDPAPLYRVRDGAAVEVGTARKHARLRVQRERAIDGQSYWVSDDGLALPADRVRVAQKREPPRGVDEGQRWVHVDLAAQTLVAYQGERPLYVTLVSSGKEGYETSPGLHHVKHKYISITMRGDDPVDGYYEVGEVPWTHYYDGSFALHGAYWHDDFGNVKSHGCVNIPPADARWLYDFSDPDVPPDWHGVRELGTAIHLTDG